jgi:hypothetical protein
MKSLLASVCLIFLVGCSATPVKRNFPEIPQSLMTACESIDQVPETKKLSVILSVVTKNYSQYQECSLKVDAWRLWYEEQQKIFNSVK